MQTRKVLAANLRRLRGARSLSQEALADAASLDRTYISSLERCIYAASVDTLDGLAQALGVEPADLLQASPVEGRPGT